MTVDADPDVEPQKYEMQMHAITILSSPTSSTEDDKIQGDLWIANLTLQT